MQHRGTRSLTTSADDNAIRRNFEFLHSFWCRRSSRSGPSVAVSQSLHMACENNDLQQVESCLAEAKYEDIDSQHPPNSETVLHIATRNQHKAIIEALLHSGAQRSLRNAAGKRAEELAESDEIRSLFKRPKISSFVFLYNGSPIDELLRRRINCRSCSLPDDNSFLRMGVDRSERSTESLTISP